MADFSDFKLRVRVSSRGYCFKVGFEAKIKIVNKSLDFEPRIGLKERVGFFLE